MNENDFLNHTFIKYESPHNRNGSIKSNNKDLMYDRDSINSTFTPATPTSSASIAVSPVNVIGSNTTASTVSISNSDIIKESPTKKKLKKIYSENEIKCDLEKNQKGYITDDQDDIRSLNSNNTDIEDRYDMINVLSITESNNSELSATIEEIIILETLERYYSYSCTIIFGLFVATIFVLFVNIYIIILILNLFVVTVSGISNPFKETTKE